MGGLSRLVFGRAGEEGQGRGGGVGGGAKSCEGSAEEGGIMERALRVEVVERREEAGSNGGVDIEPEGGEMIDG